MDESVVQDPDGRAAALARLVAQRVEEGLSGS